MRLLTIVVRVAGWYSVVGGTPLALPFLDPISNARLAALTGTGAAAAPAGADPTHLLLANTAGVLMVCMGLLLLYAARDLAHRAGIVALVALARLAFSALVLYHATGTDLASFWIVDAVIDTASSLALLALLERAGLLRPVPAPRVLGVS
jgi:hypothetical protein